MIRFLYELGQLKRVKRSGWWIAHVKDPESVADHSFRTAIVAFLIASEEGADPQRAAMMGLLQDVPEARLNDLHKVGHRYLDFKKAEADAFEEQTEQLPEKIRASMRELFRDYHSETSPEGIIARDADLLECALQAKEYIEHGHPECQDWIDNVRKLLKTQTARRLFHEMETTNSSSWWQGLKKATR